MDNELRCSIELRESEGKPSRLVGVLLPFGVQAQDRAELFERGSVSWAEGGIVLNRMHQRGSPILRFTPVESGDKLLIDVELPSTRAGDDARAEVKSGLLTGLSVEFKSIKENFVGGIRRISKGYLSAAGLVDNSSYPTTVTVEARAKAEAAAIRDREALEFLL